MARLALLSKSRGPQCPGTWSSSKQTLGDSRGSAWPCSTGGEDEEGEEGAQGL